MASSNSNNNSGVGAEAAAVDLGVLAGIQFDRDEFVGLLGKLLSHVEHLQNNPPEQNPREELAANEVVEFLKPYSQPNGPLEVRKITYVEGRSNVIIKYAGSSNRTIGFVGSHLDVVSANPETWDRNPFQLTVEGDNLYGRGVTDCLGHVAMLSCLFKKIAQLKPQLKCNLWAVFIANEEASEYPGVGVDELVKRGELQDLFNGPVFWVDSADFGPTLGTGSAITWELTAHGKLFHSGLPHKAVNAIELAHEALRYVQKRFHEDFAPHPDEEKYLFAIGSSMKPTQVRVPPGSLNQIPGKCSILGDIRLTPFYSVEEVMRSVERYVAELDVNTLPCLGFSRYEIKDTAEDGSVSALKGRLEIKWLGEPLTGIAVNMSSVGYTAIMDATAAVLGAARPFSLTGSLPIIADLQKKGFDVQTCGYGRMNAYHANNEYGVLSEFGKGFQILGVVINLIEQQTPAKRNADA